MTPFTMKNLILMAFMLTIMPLSKQLNGVHGMYVNRPQLLPLDMATDIETPTAMAAPNLYNQEIAFSSEPQENRAQTDDVQLPPYRQPPSNLLVLYPGLRELLFTPADYDEIEKSASNNPNAMANLLKKELLNFRFVEKLQSLAQNGNNNAGDYYENELNNNNNNSYEKRENDRPSMPETAAGAGNIAGAGPLNFDLNAFTFKHHGIKKNAQWPIESTFVRKAVRKQYMSPCHFKICNMGRKRHARY